MIDFDGHCLMPNTFQTNFNAIPTKRKFNWDFLNQMEWKFNKKKFKRKLKTKIKLKNNIQKCEEAKLCTRRSTVKFCAELIPKREHNNTTEQTIRKVLFLVLSAPFSLYMHMLLSFLFCWFRSFVRLFVRALGLCVRAPVCAFIHLFKCHRSFIRWNFCVGVARFDVPQFRKQVSCMFISFRVSFAQHTDRPNDRLGLISVCISQMTKKTGHCFLSVSRFKIKQQWKLNLCVFARLIYRS